MPESMSRHQLNFLFSEMEKFEATKSRANTGTGARREGEGFEKLVKNMWSAFCELAVEAGAVSCPVSGQGTKRYKKLSYERRSLVIPCDNARPALPLSENAKWLTVNFSVSSLVEQFPGEKEAIERYAPANGPYADNNYPKMFRGLKTQFDDTVLLIQDEILHEKILLEYKTAKSSNNDKIDGNAHERLSFQVMQYLEVATRYPRCSMAILANGAFVRYRNKYHVCFHVQADRLSNFAWFRLQHACTAIQYDALTRDLLSWLLNGSPRSDGTLD